MFIPYLKQTIRYLLFLTACAPFVVLNFLPSHFVTSNAFFFRIVIEFTEILFLIYFIQRPEEVIVKAKYIFKNALVISIIIFFLSAILSTVFAVNSYYAFWGTASRSEGLFGLLHYLLFLTLSLFIFSKKDWLLFFKILLGVGTVIAVLAWFQYIFSFGGGDKRLLFVLVSEDRPGSLIGNPAFLSVYLLFLIGFAAVTFLHSKKNLFWRYAPLLCMALAVVTIFITGTRGAVIGLASGILIFLALTSFMGKSQQRQRASRILLLAIVVVGLIFWFTRSTPFWEKFPALNRLTELSLQDPSVQTRLIALGSSWSAFKEKPLIGWGLENYLVAYNKYYNPDYARYEEAWFDRAHNKVAEIGVMQGALGLISYFGIFIALLYLLFKKEGYSNGAVNNSLIASRSEAIVIASLIIAYFVQNLFLFDMPTSYFMLFSLFGFVAHTTSKETDTANISLRGNPKLAAKIIAPAFIAILGYTMYAFNGVPIYQAKIYKDAAVSGIGKNVVEASEEFLRPYNFFQTAIRFDLLRTIEKNNIARKQEFLPLIELATNALKEIIERNPDYDPRQHILLADIYSEQAKDNVELFSKAEIYLREALKLAPKRHDIYYLLAFSLAGQGRFDEAVLTAREAVALTSGVAKAHYNLGIELALAGREFWDEAEEQLGKALDIGFSGELSVIRGDVANIAAAYESMLSVYIPERDRERVIRIARRYKEIQPEAGEDMDTIIGLAERGEWDILIHALR